MNDTYPSLFHAYRTEIDDPNRGETRSNEQTREALRIGKMRWMQMEAPTFLIREKRLDPKSLGIHATRFLCGSHIGDQRERLLISLCPATEQHNRTIIFPGKQPLR